MEPTVDHFFSEIPNIHTPLPLVYLLPLFHKDGHVKKKKKDPLPTGNTNWYLPMPQAYSCQLQSDFEITTK